MKEGAAADAAVQEAAKRTTSRREMSRGHSRVEPVSPEIGVLDEAAFDAAMEDDPDEALAYLMGHPERQDVRLAVGVLRSGESWCAVRTRTNDDDASVAGGADLVPGLVEAVAATLD